MLTFASVGGGVLIPFFVWTSWCWPLASLDRDNYRLEVVIMVHVNGKLNSSCLTPPAPSPWESHGEGESPMSKFKLYVPSLDWNLEKVAIAGWGKTADKAFNPSRVGCMRILLSMGCTRGYSYLAPLGLLLFFVFSTFRAIVVLILVLYKKQSVLQWIKRYLFCICWA